MKELISIITFILLCASVYAQKTPEEKIKMFFQTYEEKGFIKGVDFVFSDNDYITEDDLAELKFKSKDYFTEENTGKYYGYELITKKSLNDRLMYFSYMIKYDKIPMRFEFIYYKPDKKWKLNQFQYDTSIDDELEEAGKIYRVEGVY